MIKNYLRIAFKVLLRRKLFTFITLFGISFTIMILVIVQAEVDSISSARAPEVNLNRTLFLKRITVYSKTSVGISSLSEYFVKKYVKTLKTPHSVSLYSAGNTDNIIFLNERRVTLRTKSTDENFWQILNFEFISGKPYLRKDVVNGNHVAVISETVKTEVFRDINPIGKNLQVGEKEFRIIGVVKDAPKNRMPFADVYVPYSVYEKKGRTSASGSFEVMLLMDDEDQFTVAKEEFYSILKKVQLPEMTFDRIYCPLRSHNEWLDGGKILGVNLYKEKNTVEEDPFLSFNSTIILFMSLFILLPVLNLININTTRILERSGEIGVRKSFGASINTLTVQFIIENLFLTLIGGLLGILLASISIFLLNRSSFFSGSLEINYHVLFMAILISGIIGILSGIIPAYKMARMHPVNALRGEM